MIKKVVCTILFLTVFTTTVASAQVIGTPPVAADTINIFAYHDTNGNHHFDIGENFVGEGATAWLTNDATTLVQPFNSFGEVTFTDIHCVDTCEWSITLHLLNGRRYTLPKKVAPNPNVVVIPVPNTKVFLPLIY